MNTAANRKPHAVQACAELADWLALHEHLLRDLLSPIESQETVDDELFKSIDALSNVSKEGIADFANVGFGAAFLPINLPLYSLVIFGVIPSVFSEQMFIRPPERVQEVTRRVLETLPSGPLTDSITLCFCTRAEFMDRYVAKSTFILFTGTLKNANIVRRRVRKAQLFIFNGQGINPLVVAPGANVALAAQKACEVNRFNSGQDCAAADCMLVHADHYEAFKNHLFVQLDRLRIGEYLAGSHVGPLADPTQVLVASDHLLRRRQAIVYGGRVDIRGATVTPTVVECSSVLDANLKELFSPIWHLCRYEDERDLQQFFQRPAYRERAMYVSLFGSSPYVASQTHTVALRDEIIIDVERGNLEYGGYSIGASFVQHGGRATPRPILISRELKRAFAGAGEEAPPSHEHEGAI